MRLKKRYKVLLGILAVLVVVLGAAILWIDQIARAAVESAGESAMGVRTSLEKMSLRPLAGKGSMDGLVIGNPEGFETPHFMALGHGAVALELGSLFEDTVVVPSLRLEGLDVNLEKGDRGANYEVILANLKKGEEPPPEEAAEGKKFVIREVVMRDIRVQTDVTLAGKKLSTVELEIEEIRLENVGSETTAGSLLSGLMGKLVVATLRAVVQQGGKVLPEVVVNGVGAGLEGLGDLGKTGVRVVGKVTRKVGGKAVDALGKGLGKVAEGIGGLFGGKDED